MNKPTPEQIQAVMDKLKAKQMTLEDFKQIEDWSKYMMDMKNPPIKFKIKDPK